MPVLETINNLKAEIVQLREAGTKELKEGLLPDFMSNLDLVTEQLNQTGALVEKVYQDQEVEKDMKSSLLGQMEGNALYTGIEEDKRIQIAEKIIEDNHLNILDEETLRKEVATSLSDLDAKDLIVKAYAKDEVIRIGRSMSPAGSSEGIQYNAGIKALMELAKTPTGFEDCLAEAETKILKNTKERVQFILKYYGV
jgi:hypothetical protein